MTGPVDLGQTYRYRHTITDASGTPADAGTVTVMITLPDGTTAPGTVVHSGVGLYDIAYLTSQAGKHDLSGSATGAVLGTEIDIWEDIFTVETPLRMFISVDEASQHLRASGILTTISDREQLRWLCMVSSDAVERDLGRVISRRSVTEIYNGGRPSILLRSIPIISITSVTESGTVLDSSQYVVDTVRGMLYRGTGISSQNFFWGRQNITVVYLAGYADPPRIARKVALNGVQRMWQASQQASHPLLDSVPQEAIFSTVGALTPLELNAYKSLKPILMA